METPTEEIAEPVGCDYCGSEDLDEFGEAGDPPLCRLCREWNGD